MIHDAKPAVQRSDILSAELGLGLMTVIWAVNFSVIKVGLAELPPFGFNALRFPLAGLLLLGVLALRGALSLPDRGDTFRIIGLGLVGNGAYQFLFISGIDRTRAGNASLLLAGTPIITAVLSSALGHERLSARVWIGVLATVLGIALVIGSEPVHMGGDSVAGDLLLLAAAICWSVYTVGARNPIRRYGTMRVTAWTLWVGAVLLFLVGLPDLLRLPAPLSAGAWGSVLYSGPLGIGVAYLLWYSGVRHLGNTRTATFANVVPVLALAVAWFWLREVPNFRQLAGAAVIIGGVSLARHRT
ncbi:MAG: DMT family transporter [Gemmatimonadota bacterium]|jgi:drug/metabolite transporter (DMT)-like permease